MRTVVILFVGTVLYGYAGEAARDRGLPVWMPAVVFTICGVALQLAYAWTANHYFDVAGISGPMRWKLRSGRGVLPFRFQLIGVAARALLFAGVVLPLIAALGWLRFETVAPG